MIINEKRLTILRPVIMGISIMWIVLFHVFDYIPPLLKQLCSIGYGGVDVFLFCSAYGLCHSMKNFKNIWKWYQKRFVRIYPSYLFGCILFGPICYWSFLIFLYNISLLGFFMPMLLQTMTWWYIPAQMSLYLIFPFLWFRKHIVCKYIIPLILSIIVINILILYLFTALDWNTYINLFLYRIPVFLLGIVFYCKEMWFTGQIFRNKRFYLSLGVFSALFLINVKTYFSHEVCLIYGLRFLPVILMIPSIFIIGDIIYRIPLLRTFFSFCGKVSLELYILHVGILCICMMYDLSSYIVFILLLACFPLSFLLKSFNDKVLLLNEKRTC